MCIRDRDKAVDVIMYVKELVDQQEVSDEEIDQAIDMAAEHFQISITDADKEKLVDLFEKFKDMDLSLIHISSVESQEFSKALVRNKDRDIRMKLTSVGPHRDDLCVMADGIDIRKYGSQGQQRTAALSLKLSEIYLVKRKIKDTPVLLLDDVLSELDSSRQTYLLDSIHDISVSYTHLDVYKRQVQCCPHLR